MTSDRVVKPTHLAQRRVEGQRLVYYRRAADDQFWDEHWQKHILANAYERAEHGELGWLEEFFTRHLPRQGRILEAGCGLGSYVLALRVRGYDAEGVEWGVQTVKAVRALYPDLPIRAGDVSRLDVPDGTYSGYISLGVVEHWQKGPEPSLHEAYRVLAQDGVALISVPYFHSLRRLKARLGLYRGQPNGLDFYQYAFTETEFGSLLQNAGFKIIAKALYDGFKGVKDEVPLVRRMFRWRGIGWRLQRWLESSSWIAAHFGHMLLVVCQKCGG